jgi:hypothetical protein
VSLPSTPTHPSGDYDDAWEVSRNLSPEEAAAQLAQIRGMWELGAVVEFLSTFRPWLGLTALYPLADLEQALVESPGTGEWGVWGVCLGRWGGGG